MYRISSIAHDYATVHSLPARPLEVNCNEVTFIPIAAEEDRVRCSLRLCKINNWAVVNLNPFAVRLQEQNVSVRYFQTVGDIRGFSGRIGSILKHSFLLALSSIGSHNES